MIILFKSNFQNIVLKISRDKSNNSGGVGGRTGLCTKSEPLRFLCHAVIFVDTAL